LLSYINEFFAKVTPGAGTYNPNNHMIEMNLKIIKDQDPEILKKKPPFNIQENRFSTPKKTQSSF